MDELKSQMESIIDFLRWKFDTTGDFKYQKELKQLIKENTDDQPSND